MNDKRTEDIVRAVKSHDSGFCNPRKIKQGQELYDDAKAELINRGYSPEEAKAMLDDE